MHSLTCLHTHTHSHSFLHSFIHSLTHSLSHIHTLACSLSLSILHTLPLSLTHLHTGMHSVSLIHLFDQLVVTHSFIPHHALSLSLCLINFSHTHSLTHFISRDLSTFLSLLSPSWFQWAFLCDGSQAVCWLMSLALTWIWWHRVATLQWYAGTQGSSQTSSCVYVCVREKTGGETEM